MPYEGYDKDEIDVMMYRVHERLRYQKEQIDRLSEEVTALWDAVDRVDPEPGPIDPPVEPPVEPIPPPGRPALWAEGMGINLTVGNYANYPGFWQGSQTAVTATQAQLMLDMGIKHVRVTTPGGSHQLRTDGTFLGGVANMLEAGLEVCVAKWSGATGYDPSPMDIAGWVEDARYLANRFPDLILNPWNEPGGKHNQSVYGHHMGLSVEHSDAWVEWHAPILRAALEVNPDQQFIVDDTHWGQGAQGSADPSKSALAYWGPDLIEMTTPNIVGSIHHYETWHDKQSQLEELLDNMPFQVRFGEYGGDPNYEARGKGPNHHSVKAYPAAVQLHTDGILEHQMVLGADLWHGGASWWSGFVVSNVEGRFQPWEAPEPYTHVGSLWVDSLTSHQQ